MAMRSILYSVKKILSFMCLSFVLIWFSTSRWIISPFLIFWNELHELIFSLLCCTIPIWDLWRLSMRILSLKLSWSIIKLFLRKLTNTSNLPVKIQQDQVNKLLKCITLEGKLDLGNSFSRSWVIILKENFTVLAWTQISNLKNNMEYLGPAWVF